MGRSRIVMKSKSKHWFELQSGGAQLGFFQWMPVTVMGWITCLGIGIGWLGGPYILSEHSAEIGVIPGLVLLISSVLLIVVAILKTKRVKFD